jgi:hypothetical protein
MIKRQFYAVSGFLLLWLSSPALRAETLDFTLKGGGSTYTFQLPSTPDVSYSRDGVFFEVANVIITLDNEAELAAEVDFFFVPGGGGLEFVRDLPQLFGPQVFSDDERTATFITGDYSLADSDGVPYTLTIASPGGALLVPEPGSGLLLLTGTFATAAVLRKRAAGQFWGGSQTTI